MTLNLAFAPASVTWHSIRGHIFRVYVLKFQTLFLILFSGKMLVIRAGIHKLLVRMGNREDPDQTASSEAV